LFKNLGGAKSREKSSNNNVQSKKEEGSSLNSPSQDNQTQVQDQSLKVDLSPEEIAKFQALRSKMVSASFGEMVTLLMKSPHYKHYSLSDLEWLVVPPLMTNQFLVVEAQMKANPSEKPVEDAPQTDATTQASDVASAKTKTDESAKSSAASGVRIPVGLALWAKVSPDVDEKLSNNLESPVKLRPDEWRSGEINWLIDIIGDQTIMQGLYAKLKDDVFKGQTFKVRAQDKDGKKLVREMTGGEAAPSAPTDQ